MRKYSGTSRGSGSRVFRVRATRGQAARDYVSLTNVSVTHFWSGLMRHHPSLRS